MTGGRRLAIIKAPSILGLHPSGVEDMADALLRAGLAEATGANVVGTVHPPPYDPARDPNTRMLNADAIASYSVQLAEAVRECIGRGETPVVLGGDCSILLGALLGLRRRGRYGLVFADGHVDFYQPEASVNGEVASSELAFATGRGPAPLAALGGYPFLVREEDVILVGQRDAGEAEHYGSQPVPAVMLAFDLPAIRRLGARAVGYRVREALDGRHTQGVWVHFDVDVLGDDIMPAVDYRQPDGLGWQEAGDILKPVTRSDRFAGIDITIFNPALDREGELARQLVAFIAELLPVKDD